MALRVSIGSIGRFHTIDLAKEMEKRGALHAVYSAHPRFTLRDAPAAKLHTFPWIKAPETALARIGRRSRALNWAAIQTFDRWVASRLTACDVYHCLSCCGLLAHRRAKRDFGALTVCDRGSTHIVFQNQILTEEYARWGVPYRGEDPRVLAKEQQEYAEADLIAVPSEFVLRTFLQHGVAAAKLRKVPYGVDLSLFRPVEKRDQNFRVLFVGNVSLQKGTLYLLRAFRNIPLPKDFEIWVIGAVSKEMKGLLTAQDGVRYLGPLPRTELYRYYSQGSVLVLPSLQEGLALVQAQAMACGLPVIATPNAGCEDLITDGREGFVVPIRDPAAIREKVMALYENPALRQEMSAAALERVRGLGGWESYGRQMLAVYTSAHQSAREQHSAA